MAQHMQQVMGPLAVIGATAVRVLRGAKVVYLGVARLPRIVVLAGLGWRCWATQW